MKRAIIAGLLAVSTIGLSCRRSTEPGNGAATAPIVRGAIQGHVRLAGAVPSNDYIRMNADPMCVDTVQGQRVVNEAVLVAPDGRLANVFVQLVGSFPETPVPTDPVTIDQRGCMYRPRVVGLRAGQPLQVRNSDNGLHNVHGISTERDSFNIGQPISGMVNTFHPHDPGMLRLKCDVHTWMVAFIGVVNHPYFAVTGADGAFALRDVPEGTYDLRAWHERLGTITSQVRVDSAHETNVELTYSGQTSPRQ